MSVADITDGGLSVEYASQLSKLEGKALCDQLGVVLDNPAIYVFGEILALSNVQALAQSPATKPHFDQLEMFAFGTYDQYLARKDLPQLTAIQATKLKQLTLVTLATKHRLIPYDLLTKTLGIEKVRDIEDLVIESIYQGLVTGKLNQEQKVFEVNEVAGRDVRASDISAMLTTLSSWQSTGYIITETIKERIQEAADQQKVASIRKKEMERRADEMYKSVKTTIEMAEHDIRVTGGSAMMLDDLMNVGAHQRRKQAKGNRHG